MLTWSAAGKAKEKMPERDGTAADEEATSPKEKSEASGSRDKGTGSDKD